MSKKYQFLLFFTLLASLLTGCITPEPIHATDAIEVVITEEGFRPGKWYILSGAEITLKIINQTSTEQPWLILTRPVTIPFSEDDIERIYFKTSTPPFNEQVVIFTAMRMPGEYDVVCGVQECIDQGFMGKIIVVDPAFSN